MNVIRTTEKIIFILLILFIMFSIFSEYTYASDIIEGADGFISNGTKQGEKIPSEASRDLVYKIYNLLLIIGMIIAVIIGLVLAIQFMAGSVEAKSKVKESLVPYIAGCVVIFGAFGIWKLVLSILRDIQ